MIKMYVNSPISSLALLRQYEMTSRWLAVSIGRRLPCDEIDDLKCYDIDV